MSARPEETHLTALTPSGMCPLAGDVCPLGGAVVAGVAGAGQYLYDMVMRQERACPYRLAGAAANLAMLPLALPGAVAAARSLLGRACPTSDT